MDQRIVHGITMPMVGGRARAGQTFPLRLRLPSQPSSASVHCSPMDGPGHTDHQNRNDNPLILTIASAPQPPNNSALHLCPQLCQCGGGRILLGHRAYGTALEGRFRVHCRGIFNSG